MSNQGQPTAPTRHGQTTISGDEFLRNFHDSGLCAEEEFTKLSDTHRASSETVNGETLAKDLISSGRLTAYQADAVRERRFGDVVFGNYEVLARLGAGGMGTVYKARHRRMKRLVAIKRLSPDVAQKAAFVQRFQREVETLAQLNHPNIVMAFDADEDEIGPFLVMEFVNGRDLASDVSEHGPLSVADAVYCVRQAATGMAFAHAHGVTHRDIKPANLMRDVGGVVKVTDLGLVRLNKAEGTAGNSGITMAGGIVGTIDYIAPEQAIDSSSIDHRADIYSLGGTLFFLLAGRPPFQANTIMALLLQHRDAPVPSLCNLRAEIPPELDAICQRMLAKKPEDRFPSMAEVVRALETVQPIIAPLTRRPPKSQPAAPANAPKLDATIAADSKNQLDGNTAIARSPLIDQDFWVQGEAPAAARLTVVLAEPSRTQAAIIRKYLEELNSDNVHTATSGSEAHALVKECGAQVVISAMHLKDMTGVQLAHALHADPTCAHVGFVLTSSEGESAEIGVATRLPHVTVLAKPFDRELLAQAMARVQAG